MKTVKLFDLLDQYELRYDGYVYKFISESGDIMGQGMTFLIALNDLIVTCMGNE